VLVVNGFASTVTDIGPSGVTTTLNVGDDPNAVAITPDGKYAYVAYDVDGAPQGGVNVIDGADTSSPSVSSTPLWVGNRPSAIAISPDGNYAYVVNGGDGTVSVIDGADTPTPSVSSVLLISPGATGIAFAPNGQYAYVTNWWSDTVSIIDDAESSTPTVSSTSLNVGENPGPIAITPDGRYAFVADEGADTVSVIDGPDTSSPTVSSSTLNVGSQPSAIAFTPDGEYGYVTNWISGTVSVIDGADTSSPTVAPTVLTVGTEPSGVAITPDGQTGYVTNAGSNTLSVINDPDSSSPEVSANPVTVGDYPLAVAAGPVQVSAQESPQTIHFGTTPPTNEMVGGPNYVTAATASSGLPVILSVDSSATSVCEIAGTTVIPIGEGQCVIDANQAGNLQFSAAPEQQQTFSVARGTQTISFLNDGPGVTYVEGSSYAPATSASSNLPVSISLDKTSTGCALSGGVVSFTSVGDCIVDANQPGDAEYSPAPLVQQEIEVLQRTQSVAFSTTPPAAEAIGGPTYEPKATATSGLTVTLTLDAKSTGCTLSGGVVRYVSVGTCVVEANQSGNASYKAASELQQSIAVRVLVISTAGLPAATVGQKYSTVLVAVGGSRPYTWQLATGQLPVGLTLNKTTGAITGVPTKSSTSSTFTVEVSDAKVGKAKDTAVVRFSIAIL
jgi:YVTN family beta-propeller protein